MSSEIAIPENSVLARVVAAPNATIRASLQLAAMEPIEDERFDRKVPRFLTELPWGGNSEDITDRIASAVLVAEDPDEAQKLQGTTAGMNLVGRGCTIHDLVVMKGDKPNGWAGYLLLDVSMDDDPTHIVVNTGAKQAVARLARAWAEGELPVKGVFALIEGTGKQGTPAVTFIVERPFT